ncbi:thiamine pyrophosphate-binding protein [Bacteriovoracaceae bacterium]|nr:thiamine pyrophosphate-binding protein [Bacteriovoracaceae bacterium]
MKMTGGELVCYALEQIGVKYTFGIPGVHTTEIYDALNKSDRITPVLVAHEGGGSFMADSISRTSDSIGCIVTVPGAGTTHAASGLGEAYLDGIPVLAISGGVRRDSGRAYQLHDLDQGKMVQGISKVFFLVEKFEDIIPTIYKAYDLATAGEPGPAFVEVASNLLLFATNVSESELPRYTLPSKPKFNDQQRLDEVISLFKSSKKIGIYAGWGAVDAQAELIELAELLCAPVSTTMQGLSTFPHKHPLHTGMGFGKSAVPAAENAFYGIDALFAIGVRFAELATGSYGIEVPENLIHIDINPEVFNKNYPAKITAESDSKAFLSALVARMKETNFSAREDVDLKSKIKKDKEEYYNSWKTSKNENKVSPGFFFESLHQTLGEDAIVLADDGNHTFLTAELMPINKPRHFSAPTDFNCMGYCIPATIAAKLANPNKPVAGIVGDGAFLMTGLEIITATSLNLGAIFFVFHDGELAQISQFQEIPLNRKTCTVLNDIKVEGVAIATGAKYLSIENDFEIAAKMKQALEFSQQNMPVLVDVKIDYSQKTKFTKGVVKTNLSRFPLGEKVRFIGRAVKRHILG